MTQPGLEVRRSDADRHLVSAAARGPESHTALDDGLQPGIMAVPLISTHLAPLRRRPGGHDAPVDGETSRIPTVLRRTPAGGVIRRGRGTPETAGAADLFQQLPPSVQAAFRRLPLPIQQWLAGLQAEVQQALSQLDEDVQLQIIAALAAFAAGSGSGTGPGSAGGSGQGSGTQGAIVPARRGAPTVTPVMTAEFAEFLQGRSHLPEWLVRPESPDGADRALVARPRVRSRPYDLDERQRDARAVELTVVGAEQAVTGAAAQGKAALSANLELKQEIGPKDGDPTASVTSTKKRHAWEQTKRAEDRKEGTTDLGSAAAVTGPNRADAASEQLDRQLPFGQREGAYQAAVGVASQRAQASFQSTVQALDDDRSAKQGALDEAEAKARKKKKPRGRGGKNNGAKGPQAPVGPTPKEEFDAGVEQAEQKRTADLRALTGKLAGVAASPSGAKLSEAELSWVMTASGGSVALAQALADLAAAGPDGFALAQQIMGGQNALALAPVCGRLLTLGAPTNDIPRGAEMLLGRESQPFGLFLTGCIATNTFGAALDFSTRYLKNLPLVTSICPTLGFGTLAEDFLALMIKTKAKTTEVTTLLALSGDPAFGKLVSTLDLREPPILSVCALLAPANLAHFTLLEMIAIINRCPKALGVALAVLPSADDHCPSFVSLIVNALGGDLSNVQLISAFRGEALLADGVVAFTITQQQADVPYVGGANYQAQNLANGARTGFATLTFPSGALAYIHLHWNSQGTAKGIVSSMHVQLAANGQNGLELDEWMSFFPLLPVAVCNALNNAASPPTGGPIKMAKK